MPGNALDVLHAGKYAVYVYPAYGLTALVLIGLVLESLWAARGAQKRACGEDEDRR
jgi:heme exporter protein CcmD